MIKLVISFVKIVKSLQFLFTICIDFGDNIVPAILTPEKQKYFLGQS